MNYILILPIYRFRYTKIQCLKYTHFEICMYSININIKNIVFVSKAIGFKNDLNCLYDYWTNE